MEIFLLRKNGDNYFFLWLFVSVWRNKAQICLDLESDKKFVKKEFWKKKNVYVVRIKIRLILTR